MIESDGGAQSPAAEPRLVLFDQEAREIGDLYRRAKASVVDSVRYLIDCGRRLQRKKAELEHGQWERWLTDNRDNLGFGLSAARALMKAANLQLTGDLDEKEALRINQQIWGNELLEDNRAQREADQQTAEQIPLPDSVYRCIVIDPPWEMEKILRHAAPAQIGFDYPTMDEDQLAAFNVGGMAAEDCHLFCWTTHKHLPLALRLLDPWGFHYVLTMVWHKPGGFQPFGLPQYNCEFILYARRGSPEFVETTAFPTCFNAPRREHSRKPDEFYDLIARVTAGPRIDVFSREPRPGFDQFGNEVGKFAA